MVLAVAALAAIAGVRPVPAAETDQYLAWGVELTDSAAPVNRFVNREFERQLARLTRKGRERPCEAIPGRLYEHVFPNLAGSRLRRFLQQSPDLDLFPPSRVGYWEYRSRSVLRRKAFPVVLPLARTVRIGDVYLGTDKLSHFFGFGRRYYGRFRWDVRRGRPPEEAERRSILWGLENERTFVGGVVDGIVSHADLEANYQGLRLARDLCEGDDPFLVRGGGGWRLARPVDLRAYVNPAFDESYYPNLYVSYRWPLVRPILLAEVCPRLDSPEVRARRARYREIDRPSFSRRVIAENYARGERGSPERHGIEAVCYRSERNGLGAP